MSALVAWLWQGAAIALATVVLLRAMPRLNAATRHAIWWCALAGVLAAPFVGILLAAAPAAASATGDLLPGGVLVVPAVPDWAIAAAIGAWLGTLLLGIARTANGVRLLSRLKIDSMPLEKARETRLAMWRSTLECGRRSQLRVSQAAVAASALGLRRPVILLSRDLVDALDDEALDQVVMHERAHLLRYDDWSRLLQSILMAIVGLHPAVRFISRQIDLEREAACDDAVVVRTGAVRQYAACLADAASIAAVGATTMNGALSPSVTGPAVSLRVRIARLLDPRRARDARLAPIATAASLLTLACAVALSHHTAPKVIFADVLERQAVNRPDSRAVERWGAPVAARADTHPIARSDEQAAAPSRNRALAPSLRRGSPEPGAPAVANPPVTDQITADHRLLAAVDADPVPLASSSLASTIDAPVSVTMSDTRRAASAPARSGTDVKWSSLGAPGVAIGRGAKSIAGFFGGAAKAVAASF